MSFSGMVFGFIPAHTAEKNHAPSPGWEQVPVHQSSCGIAQGTKTAGHCGSNYLKKLLEKS